MYEIVCAEKLYVVDDWLDHDCVCLAIVIGSRPLISNIKREGVVTELP